MIIKVCYKKSGGEMAKLKLIFHDDAEIEEMRIATGREKKGEVARDALWVYGELIKLVQKGAEIFYRDEVGEEKKLKISTLERAREIAEEEAAKRSESAN